MFFISRCITSTYVFSIYAMETVEYLQDYTK